MLQQISYAEDRRYKCAHRVDFWGVLCNISAPHLQFLQTSLTIFRGLCVFRETNLQNFHHMQTALEHIVGLSKSTITSAPYHLN